MVWALLYLVLIAGVRGLLRDDILLSTALWLRIVYNALWLVAIVSLYSRPSPRWALALFALIPFSILAALVSYVNPHIVASQSFVFLDAVCCAIIFIALALSIFELRLSKIAIVAFLFHAFTQWQWPGLLFRPPLNPLVLVFFPVWHAGLLYYWKKMIPQFLQLAQSRTVFLCYRRKDVGKWFAKALQLALSPHGYDVFLDVDDVGAGEWEEQILKEVRTRSHFILAVTPGALDRCDDRNDFLRREFEAADSSRRNIVPVLEGSIVLKELEQSCPAAMKRIFNFQIATIRYNGFDRDVADLIARFLRPDKAPSPRGENQSEKDRGAFEVSLITPFRVMISLTDNGLQTEKQVTENAIKSLPLDRFRAEPIARTPDHSLSICAEMAKRCALFILIIGERYGNLVEDGRSFVEFEFDMAQAQNPQKILVYVKDVAGREPREEEFLRKVHRLHPVSPFATSEELSERVNADVLQSLTARAEQPARTDE